MVIIREERLGDVGMTAEITKAAFANHPHSENTEQFIVNALRAATKAKHPTNWHLSAHRAISVQKILAGAGVAESRTAVVGMGEFRPIEPNKANKGGNPRNRRVEMYIVPAKSIGG